MAGSTNDAQWFADNEPGVIRADYVLTEHGGLHGGSPEQPCVGRKVAEKGVTWRRLRVRGNPGHGSMPFRADNPLVKAAAVVQRISEYSPPPRFTELWTEQVESISVDGETKAAMLNPDTLDELLADLPNAGTASFLHACTHTTFSANLIDGGLMNANVIPDAVEIQVDVLTLPGEDAAADQDHLDRALGDMADLVDVDIIMDDPASISRTDNLLWEGLQRAVSRPFPSARISPQSTVGFTDARVF